MYWNLLKVIILTFAPVVPIGAKFTRVDPGKHEWIFSIREWKSPYELAHEVYLEHYPPVKTE
jgi:hypothetical protein